jgi:hypothetical protein
LFGSARKSNTLSTGVSTRISCTIVFMFMTSSFLISENGLLLLQISGGGMGALTQLGAKWLAIQFVSTRGSPPFFDRLVQLAVLEKPSLPF